MQRWMPCQKRYPANPTSLCCQAEHGQFCETTAVLCCGPSIHAKLSKSLRHLFPSTVPRLEDCPRQRGHRPPRHNLNYMLGYEQAMHPRSHQQCYLLASVPMAPEQPLQGPGHAAQGAPGLCY
mmetsp:Transcript_69447/g.183432  ORF Transcript_69447/g.183432 Transcript_69447/m.183432 type:complete len:123 (-) Transcript_69447:19-387(-)